MNTIMNIQVTEKAGNLLTRLVSIYFSTNSWPAASIKMFAANLLNCLLRPRGQFTARALTTRCLVDHCLDVAVTSIPITILLLLLHYYCYCYICYYRKATAVSKHGTIKAYGGHEGQDLEVDFIILVQCVRLFFKLIHFNASCDYIINIYAY
jgi:hypothetical protein